MNFKGWIIWNSLNPLLSCFCYLSGVVGSFNRCFERAVPFLVKLILRHDTLLYQLPVVFKCLLEVLNCLALFVSYAIVYRSKHYGPVWVTFGGLVDAVEFVLSFRSTKKDSVAEMVSES